MSPFPSTPKSAATLAGIALSTLCLAAPLQASLINGGFEVPVVTANNYTFVDQSQFPGWQTTASDHKIEVWSTGFAGVTAFEGNQFVELNANMQSTLYQDLAPVAGGERVTFQLAHQGRVTVESMQFSITDLGADGIYGTADDTSLFSRVYADGTGGWGTYTSTGEPWIYTLGNAMRISLASLDPGSFGNFVDGVSINASPLAVAPEPATWAALALLGISSLGGSVLRRMGVRARA